MEDTNNFSRRWFPPNALLFLFLFIIIFVTPALPADLHQISYSIMFSCVFISSALSSQHENRNKRLFYALILIAAVWITDRINLPVLSYMSKLAQAIFFILIVINLIRQTAKAKVVTPRVILDSVNGYLMVGITYTILTYAILNANSGAYTFPVYDKTADSDMSRMFYYTFVTFTSTGYGDITPLSTIARACATMISVTGQLYVAILIAMLVGKFSGSSKNS
jgi:voltage-gated potassium channel